MESNEFISDECVFVATSVCDNGHLLWVLTAIMTAPFFNSLFTINYVIIHFGGGCNLKECYESGLLERGNGRWALSKPPLAGQGCVTSEHRASPMLVVCDVSILNHSRLTLL